METAACVFMWVMATVGIWSRVGTSDSDRLDEQSMCPRLGRACDAACAVSACGCGSRESTPRVLRLAGGRVCHIRNPRLANERGELKC